MKGYVFLFALILNSSTSYSQTIPQIHSSRPRIYIDSTRFAQLQSALSSGDCGSTYTAFRNAVYSNWYNDPQLYLLGVDSTQWTWDFNSSWAPYQGMFVPALFKLSGDTTELSRCRYLIRQINARFDTLDFSNYNWYANEDEIRTMADMGCLLLDWCYNDLPNALRQQYAQTLFKICRYFMNTYINTAAGTSYVTGHNIWNVYYANQFSLCLYGSDGLDSLQNDTILQWYQISYDKAVNEILPVAGYYRDDDGGWNWTAAYSMWSLIDEFQFFENMRIATGKNFYVDLPWIQNSINQYWHFIQPDGWTINWGDGFTRLSGDRAIYLHARMYNDPRSMWLAQVHSSPANITWTWPLFQKLLYKDFNATPITQQPLVPTDWFSDKTGLSVSRTSWTDTASLVWVYNAPTKKAGHEHRDNNSFCVYKHSPQIINSGYYDSYGSSHYINYYMRSVSHNTICIFDSTEYYTNWGVSVSNDGGQIESPTLMNYSDVFSPSAQKGKWILNGSQLNYSYSISDATLSYDSAKTDRMLRRVLFHKPNKVIVLDHIQLKNTSTNQREPRFLLHFQNQPLLNGSPVQVSVPEHIETFSNSDIFQSNGNGNVAIRTLLPSSFRTTRIGGSGYEFYVNGSNYQVSGSMDTSHTTPGKWRVEVVPETQSDTVLFFHTIKIGETATPAQAGGLAQKNNLSVCVDWESTLYFFNAQGDTGTVNHLMDSVSGNRTVNIFATDLAAFSNYVVLIDNVIVSTTYSDQNGVTQTNLSLPLGTHNVSLMQVPSTTLALNEGSELISISPNPSINTATLSLNPLRGAVTHLYIRTASGNFVKELVINHSITLTTNGLSPGVYFITAVAQNLTQTIKWVVN